MNKNEKYDLYLDNSKLFAFPEVQKRQEKDKFEKKGFLIDSEKSLTPGSYPLLDYGTDKGDMRRISVIEYIPENAIRGFNYFFVAYHNLNHLCFLREGLIINEGNGELGDPIVLPEEILKGNMLVSCRYAGGVMLSEEQMTKKNLEIIISN